MDIGKGILSWQIMGIRACDYTWARNTHNLAALQLTVFI